MNDVYKNVDCYYYVIQHKNPKVEEQCAEFHDSNTDLFPPESKKGPEMIFDCQSRLGFSGFITLPAAAKGLRNLKKYLENYWDNRSAPPFKDCEFRIVKRIVKIQTIEISTEDLVEALCGL